MNNSILSVALVHGALLGFPCLGMLCGVGMFALESAGQFSEWQSLGAPLEMPNAIVAGDTTAVYVATQSNRIYGCQHRGEQTYGWLAVDQLPQLDSRAQPDSSVFEGHVSPPPGTVISELKITRWGAETADETRYALLADGTVWRWKYSRVGFIALLGNLLVRAIGGAMLGVPLARFCAHRRQPRAGAR